MSIVKNIRVVLFGKVTGASLLSGHRGFYLVMKRQEREVNFKGKRVRVRGAVTLLHMARTKTALPIRRVSQSDC